MAGIDGQKSFGEVLGDGGKRCDGGDARIPIKIPGPRRGQVGEGKAAIQVYLPYYTKLIVISYSRDS